MLGGGGGGCKCTTYVEVDPTFKKGGGVQVNILFNFPWVINKHLYLVNIIHVSPADSYLPIVKR